MIKNFIKKGLYSIGIYDVSRKAIVVFYYPYKSYKIRKNAKIILDKLNTVFSEHTQDYWLDYGTLLGYVREKKIIKGDLDLDFGVISQETLAHYLKEEDIHITQQTIVDEVITMEQYRYKDIGFDIFYYRDIDDKFITNIWLADDYTIPQKESYNKDRGILYETTFSSLETIDIEFYETPFKIPKNYDLYLSEHYGDDYMIPNSHFRLEDEKNKQKVSKTFEVKFYE
jgi:hypothetical protein